MDTTRAEGEIELTLDMPKATLVLDYAAEPPRRSPRPEVQARTQDYTEIELDDGTQVILDHISSRPELQGVASLHLVTECMAMELADLDADELRKIASTCESFAAQLNARLALDGVASLHLITDRAVLQLAGLTLAGARAIADRCRWFAGRLEQHNQSQVEVNHG